MDLKEPSTNISKQNHTGLFTLPLTLAQFICMHTEYTSPCWQTYLLFLIHAHKLASRRKQIKWKEELSGDRLGSLNVWHSAIICWQ